MGMDIYGNRAGTYFRASIWEWKAMIYAFALADFYPPKEWNTNDGAGLETQEECDELADKLATFLKSWDENELEFKIGKLRVDEEGKLYDSAEHGEKPGSRFPYITTRETLQDFVKFLRMCSGFRIM